MDFYDELDMPGADAWRRVGWRRQIEQAYRFEVALEVLAGVRGVVADVGCGLGEFSRYARASGATCDFVGIERRREFACEVPHEVIESDFRDVDIQASVAVAIGTLTGGADVRDLMRFLERAAPVFVATALRADGLGMRPLLAAEHSGSALAADWSWPGADVIVISPTDVAVVTAGVMLRTIPQRYDAVLAGPWGGQFDALERAWLGCELELWDVARAALLDVPDSEFARLLRERTALASVS